MAREFDVQEGEMPTGKIAILVNQGFGFIVAEFDKASETTMCGSQLVHFHHSAVERVPCGGLEAGRRVEYELADRPCSGQAGYHGGPQAVAVRFI